jgi:hypothetical protein
VKKLIAGPWLGEFGWELFAWQGYVRTLSEKFDETLIISRKNSFYLYQDFADQFCALDVEGGLSDAWFMHGADLMDCFKSCVKKYKLSLDKDTTVLFPKRIGIPPHTHYTQPVLIGEHLTKPKYICFGEEQDRKYDYIFHVRDRDLRKEDNWSLDNWMSLKEMLGDKKIACIGTKKESGHIEGTADLRDLGLKEVFSVMRNAECAFGPSSGPMHLASLCGLPHIVWSIPQNKIRYEENWNPLQTPVLFNSEFDWHPSPEYVYNLFREWKR